MFRRSIARREIAESWQWIRKNYPELYKEAVNWVAEHKEEMKKVDRILYDSETKYYRKFGFAELETEEEKEPASPDPDYYIPKDVLNRIYDDKRWFVREKYMPKDSDDEPYMYLTEGIVEGLHELTELQREVLFRTVINGEPVASVAMDKGCSDRNIRDIRARALNHLRKKAEGDRIGSLYVVSLLVICALALAAYFLLHPLLGIIEALPAWLTYSLALLLVIVLVFVERHRRLKSAKDMLRRWWARMACKAEDK